ncbi:PEP/pyruvate-binding domain-containing protein [Rhodococcus sp. UNC363MFTsu5.1]|uniref:PEP/pyruvate-binding domain-containing protein n=1 Tax=Rhodococcus sp. UNC363MFTsu5.1 TaxID=1449069 RepID=UPI0004837956|nr:PEP/pyruvate-binding domain-containing protein [Rhodococcus sp. UNC363MFTsu5.1]
MLVPLSRADERSGAKAATLARLAREGFRVPAGFVIEDALGDDSWAGELETALPELGSGAFAVRSSALVEDGVHASFAGQLDTSLGATTAVQVAEEVRRIAASGTRSRTVAYAARTGRSPRPVEPVIVQALVRPQVAGVLFTRDPVAGTGQVVIEAHPGLGESVVGGSVTPQRWIVDGHRVAPAANAVAQPVLTVTQVLALAETGRRIEASFGCPQDIEWAIANGTVWVLQARPITTSGAAPGAPSPHIAGTALLAGTPAGPGIAAGPVRVIGRLDDFTRFRGGDVLVCRTTSPAWTPLLARAAAVVTEIGGVLAHAAIVAREFGIPAVTAAAGATAVLADGMRVIVDGTNGTVTTERSGHSDHPEHTAENT